jgi:hypothetical protein
MIDHFYASGGWDAGLSRKAIRDIMPKHRPSLLRYAGSAALLLLSLTAPGCRRIDPSGPEPLPPPGREVAPLSSIISAPIEIPLAEVDTLVNSVVPQQLYASDSVRVRKGIARANLSLDVMRGGRIWLETEEGAVITYIPLRVDGEIRSIGVRRPFSTTFTVRAVSELGLDEDWTTRVYTRSGFTWRTAPSINLLGFTINLEHIAGKAIDAQLARLSPRIDSLIEERINLRPRLERLWASLNEPIRLRRQDPPVWLQARPTRVYLAPPESRGNTLVYGVRIHALMSTVVGSEPPTADLGPLPPLQALPDSLAGAPSHFNVSLPLTLSYEDARDLLDGVLTRQDYDLKEAASFRVTDLDLYGHGETLVARLDFNLKLQDAFFATRGRVFMTGRPVYDPVNRSVRVDSFDYDVSSRDALIHAADFALREPLLAAVQDRLAISLGARLDTLRGRLQNELDGRALGRLLMLEGTVSGLEPSALYLTPDGIRVDVRAHGDLTVQLRSLSHVASRPGRVRTATGK